VSKGYTSIQPKFQAERVGEVFVKNILFSVCAIWHRHGEDFKYRKQVWWVGVGKTGETPHPPCLQLLDQQLLHHADLTPVICFEVKQVSFVAVYC